MALITDIKDDIKQKVKRDGVGNLSWKKKEAAMYFVGCSLYFVLILSFLNAFIPKNAEAEEIPEWNSLPGNLTKVPQKFIVNGTYYLLTTSGPPTEAFSAAWWMICGLIVGLCVLTAGALAVVSGIRYRALVELEEELAEANGDKDVEAGDA